MTVIVADADGLIKLGKSGALPRMLSATRMLIPAIVYEEAVVAGKKEMYEDAFELERVLRVGGAEVVSEVEEGGSEEAEDLLRDAASLGAGERAALRVLYARGADAVLTDDRAFVNLLRRAEATVLLPASAIVLLAKSGGMGAKEALAALQRIERLVRREVYEEARRELNGLIGKEKGR